MHTAILPERSGRAWGHSKVIEKGKSSAQQGETAPLLLEDSPMKTHRTQVCLHLFSNSLWSFRVSWPDSTGWSAGSRGKTVHCICGSPLPVRSSSCVGSSHGRGIPKTDATRLGSEKLSERIVQLQRSLHRLTASAHTVQVTDPNRHHSASQRLYECIAASRCRFRTYRFRSLLARRLSQWPGFSRSYLCRLRWAAAAWCRWGGSRRCSGNLLRLRWVCANTAGPLSNLNFTFLLLSPAFPKILSQVLDFQIYHLCTPWFMLTGRLPKTSSLRSLFQHHGSFPEQDSLGWEADPPSLLLLGSNKPLWEGTFPSTAFSRHHLLLQLQDAFLWLGYS